MNTVQPLGLLVGRVLLALIFIGSGFSKITGFADTAASMAAKGIPMVEVLLIIAILIELGGGLLLALGYKARWAALAIFLFLIPATLIFHAFWAVDPEQVKMQLIQFQKNLAIMGGMLYVVFNGPGRMSLDRA
ncbi:MAG: DoxX family protein [Pseudomonadota bacterium]|nr:DoxX family protein [Pseudomonadota bacterium]